MEAKALPEKAAYNCQVAQCLHCNVPIKSGASFCCFGCESAYAVIHTLTESPSHSSQPVFSTAAIKDSKGNYTLSLLVKGIHCASCIQLIENALHNQKEVIFARVNMSTERLTITWKGKKERADALATIVKKLGYQVKICDATNHHEGSSPQESFLLRCIAISGFSMGNLMMISIALWSSDMKTMGMATQDFFHLISAIIALPTILYAGSPFFYSAWSVLKERHTNMDVPISLAVILASSMSVIEALNHGEHVYFDSAIMLLFFLLIGRYLDIRAKGKARKSAQDLLSMLHGTATILDNNNNTSSVIPIRSLREGMIVFVAVGENIPADGVVSQGATELDMSLITGETLPHPVKKGDKVFAGTTNLATPIQLTVSKASDSSLLSDIVKLMEKAEQNQSHYVRLADKAAKLYTPIVHTLGLLTFLGWWLIMKQPWQPSLLHAITVLIITCPCALGLAVPVVQVLASSRLMQKAILLKSGDALEKLSTIDTVVFDKTGTLTIGKPSLQQGHHTQKELQLAASLASHSKHPLSKALYHTYDDKLLNIQHIEEIAGKGIQATIDGKIVKLGNKEWCGDTSEDNSPALELWLAQEEKKPIKFTFSDSLRSDAKQVIEKFQHANIQTILLSGDRKEAVTHIAHTLGIQQQHAKFSPTEKCHFLETLKKHGSHILMVGDGLNDAPSLATADISISPSTAMDITQNTADIVFQGEKLSPIIHAWETAKNANRLVKQNFTLAVLYNLIAIPLAVTGHVTPLIAAIAMSSSSLIVICNSFRLNLEELT